MRGKIARPTHLLVMMVAAILLVTLIPLAGTSAATPFTSTFAVGPNAWAYGGVKTISVAMPTANGTASGSAYYGQATVLSQSAGTNGSISIEAQHTSGAGVDVAYCSPSCTAAVYYEVIWDYHVWENITSFANFTNSAPMSTSAGNATGLGLLNSDSQFAANLTEFLEVELHTAKITTTYSRSLSVGVAGSASLAFLPASPLGLIPSDVAAVATWSDSAPYSAAWAWSASYYNHTVSAIGNHVNQTSFVGNGTIPNGTMNLSGVNDGTAITLGGKSMLVLSLSISGAPFDLRDGFILIPSSADLFGSARHAWSASQTGLTTTQLGNVDYYAGASNHIGILATRQIYSSAPFAANASDAGGFTEAAPPGIPTLQQVGVQGQPESVGQATQNQQCLTADSCSAAAGPTSPLRELVVVGAVVGLVVVVLALVVQRRRQLPAPVYPNAKLYPVGTPLPPSTTAPRTTTETPKDSEPDPLGNLW
jgi:MYXO-CTERM domain-containing protein